MSTLLAIDTSSTHCTVALRIADKLFSHTLDTGRHTAQQVLTVLAKVLAQSQSTLGAIDAIAVMAGPGSFTGIRIGVGAAQGLALAHNTPVLPVSVMAVKALAALQAEPAHHHVLVCEIARDAEVYFAAYRRSDSAGVELLGDEQVGAADEVQIDRLHSAAATHWLAAGDGWQTHTALPASLGVEVILPAFTSPLSSAVLCELALLRLRRGDALSAELALPNYVKDTLDYAR